uniref:Uncharacterized protein n=1 Tax=Nyssomyia neivai TaxID=330878 RepID=A0A1L8D6U9_9DIPT
MSLIMSVILYLVVFYITKVHTIFLVIYYLHLIYRILTTTWILTIIKVICPSIFVKIDRFKVICLKHLISIGFILLRILLSIIRMIIVAFGVYPLTRQANKLLQQSHRLLEC